MLAVLTVLYALMWAVYKSLAANRESFTVIHVEKNLEPDDDEGRGR